ncbi:LA2681 family HEPN domain-containing protein [Micromonospora aurantiaca (nom. illeg.)]|uniref:LA2681 family HEPN domain-containing protein n=1 Tax=Micromonospora aurantiaca (nom. illeg.) TaxID=47850 RepID=UPI003EBEE297
MEFSAEYLRLYKLVHQTGDRSVAAVEAATTILSIAAEVESATLSSEEAAAIRFMCSSVLLNAAFDLHDAALLKQGRDLAEQALAETGPDEPLRFQCIYNIANAIVAECDEGLLKQAGHDDWVPSLIENRLAHRLHLREARSLYFEAASSPSADPHTRSAAYCNLANSLDHSGRWAEAYDFYLRALEEDPRNGNAAGNLAQLLYSRIQSGTGQLGHMAAVYDKYVTMAKSLREGTLSFAGEGTADRWDALNLTESEGHLSHGLADSDDDYRHWVAAHRLALSPAVEGLGTDDPHWDGAVIEVLYGSTAADVMPPILAEMNVLKSDFLVSRRLAFDGIVQVAEGPEQKDDDSGYYIETLDHSLYGTQYAKLLLAQRSALDVLDKTAVVVNEYLNVGDRPDRVSFRKFWTNKDGSVRESLIKRPTRALPAFALSELAFDMDKGGLYAASQDLRNAGTHRIVHAAFLNATGVTPDSRSRVGLFDLVDSTILALQVTRSAFLYIIDLVATWNHPDDHQGDYQSLQSFEYMQFPDLKDDGTSATD